MNERGTQQKIHPGARYLPKRILISTISGWFTQLYVAKKNIAKNFTRLDLVFYYLRGYAYPITVQQAQVCHQTL